MCDFTTNCSAAAEYRVIHKACGAREEFTRYACYACAARIGHRSPSGALIEQPGQENRFYRIEDV